MVTQNFYVDSKIGTVLLF